MLIIDIGDLMDRGRETDDREYWLVTSLWIATQYSKQFRKLSEELHPLSSVIRPQASVYSTTLPAALCVRGLAGRFRLPSSVPGPQSHVLRLRSVVNSLK